MTVIYKGNNLFEVERTERLLFWKRTYVAHAYWYEPEFGVGGWYWVDTDEMVDDEDTRIALSEAYLRR